MIDLEAATGDGAVRIWEDCPKGNVAFDLSYGDKATTDRVFARAKHVVAVRLENNRVTANSLKPRAAIGSYDSTDEGYTLHTSSQNPHGVRSLAARHVLHVPETKIRVIAPDVGGGFGLKSNAHVEDSLYCGLHGAVAARSNGRRRVLKRFLATIRAAAKSCMGKLRSTKMARYSELGRARCMQ